MNVSTRKLEALTKRKAAIAEALRLEREKRKAIACREEERLTGILGRAVLATAAQSPEFKHLISGVLRTTVTHESEQRFLKSRNWL